jgi:hypothetical protein
MRPCSPAGRADAELRGLLAAGDPRGEVRLARHATETLRGLYDITSPELAGEYLTELTENLADSDRPPELRRLGRTLDRRHTQIVTWHRARVTNGPTEPSTTSSNASNASPTDSADSPSNSPRTHKGNNSASATLAPAPGYSTPTNQPKPATPPPQQQPQPPPPKPAPICKPPPPKHVPTNTQPPRKPPGFTPDTQQPAPGGQGPNLWRCADASNSSNRGRRRTASGAANVAP